MSIENTGQYRVYRDKTGISGSKEILYEGDGISGLTNFYKGLIREDGFNYYKQEEVIYKGGLLDSGHQPTPSTPSWRNID